MHPRIRSFWTVLRWTFLTSAFVWGGCFPSTGDGEYSGSEATAVHHSHGEYPGAVAACWGGVVSCICLFLSSLGFSSWFVLGLASGVKQ